jgi:hypothetical protein
MTEEIENENLRNRDELSKVGLYPLTIANTYKHLRRIYNAYWVKLTLGRLEWHSLKPTKRKTVAHLLGPRRLQRKPHLLLTSVKMRLLLAPMAPKLSVDAVVTRITSRQNVALQAKNPRSTRLSKVATRDTASSSLPL